MSVMPGVRRGVQVAAIKAHRISSLTLAAATTWTDWTFEEVVDDESLAGVVLEADGKTFRIDQPDLYYVSGCVRPLWTGTPGTRVLVATRVVASTDGGTTFVEKRCLQSVTERAAQANEVGTQHYMGTVLAHEPGLLVRLQVWVANVGMTFAGWSAGFDFPVSGSIQMMGAGQPLDFAHLVGDR